MNPLNEDNINLKYPAFWVNAYLIPNLPMFSNLSEGRCLDLKDFDNIIDIYIYQIQITFFNNYIHINFVFWFSRVN